MSHEVTTIRMRNLAHIERHNNMIAATHLRMQEISLAYEKALDEELKVIQDSTITEDTMIDEMIQQASQGHRDRIKEMRAIPPLSLDGDRQQLQIRCAAAEEKAENLQEQLQARQGSEMKARAENHERELQKARAENHEHELQELHRAYKTIQERSAKRGDKIGWLEVDKNVLEKANEDLE
jgi:hypothetical protein